MPKALFLVDGGNYKRGVDDGRSRVPLTYDEAQMIFHDPEVPGPGSPSSIATEFNMQKWSEYLCNLEVDDELFIGLLPDAALYRSMWMMSFDSLSNFTVTVDLVSVKDVYTAHLAGDATGVASWITGAETIDYDFADGLGDATIDAIQKADLYGGLASQYRNEAALVATPFATQLAGLGEALYIRLTITERPAAGFGFEGCCTNCGDVNMPTFQVGAVYDVLCADKQRVRHFCNCPEKCPAVECPPVVPTVVIDAVLTDNTSDGTVALAVQFSHGVEGFDETDVATLITGAVVGGTITFDSLVVTDAATYIVNYDVGYGDDAGGNISFDIAADSVTAVLGGLGNTASNTDNVTIPGGA